MMMTTWSSSVHQTQTYRPQYQLLYRLPSSQMPMTRTSKNSSPPHPPVSRIHCTLPRQRPCDQSSSASDERGQGIAVGMVQEGPRWI